MEIVTNPAGTCLLVRGVIGTIGKIGPALDTFRDPEAREKAMAAHCMDSVARRGLLGQGTYTVDYQADYY